MKSTITISMIFISLSLVGCANDPELGITVSQLRAEQTYNPNASQENLGYVPEGHGPRSQTSLKGYPSAGVAKKRK
ncbi:hypothetical protein H2O73_08140 [Vibrio sp. 404]|uniref:Lipoprotein n=1 Tax=Vibrio marinisediminis TaxID=2758441 RepID=A0A7W2ITQ2_9VIBR|nr:hypothetical protein [Vibrio marinisediminis]MBA5762307.1 hypothetical protein [Vibrio marinisediminis]